MRDYLENKKLMCPQQHDFMSQKSILSNLLLCDELIAQYLNDRKPCDSFLLNFTRAFDKVSHKILQNKLISIWISGKLYQWLDGFLRDRSQFVSYCIVSLESVPLKLESYREVWPAPNFSILWLVIYQDMTHRWG